MPKKEMSFEEAAAWVVEEAIRQVVILGHIQPNGAQFVAYCGLTAMSGARMSRLKYNVGPDRRPGFRPHPLRDYNPLGLSLHTGDDRHVVVERDLRASLVEPVKASTFKVKILRGADWDDCPREHFLVSAYLNRINEQLRMRYAGADVDEQWAIASLVYKIEELLGCSLGRQYLNAMPPL